MNKVKTLVLASLIALASATNAETIAWFPFVADIGTRTSADIPLENKITGEQISAWPLSMEADNIIPGSESCPVGATGFPLGWGVWNSQEAVSSDTSRSLAFQLANKKGGAVKIVHGGRLNLQTFTFEAFVRVDKSATTDAWQCLAALPGKLSTSTGAKVVNFDSWALRFTSDTQLQARFTKAEAAETDITNVGSYNQAMDIPASGIKDGKWHHIALVVSAADKKAWAYIDYKIAKTFPNQLPPLYYGSEDLYVGATPQSNQQFGGSIANVRLSDKALKTNEFLQLTDLVDVADDVVLHANFELPPDGLSAVTTQPFNRGRGSYLELIQDADGFPKLSDSAEPAVERTYSSLLSTNGVSNSRDLVSSPNESGTFTYGKFIPDGDQFATGSFTVECFYKTTQSKQYVPLVRRRGGWNVQFNMGFGGTLGKLSASVLPKDNGTQVALNDPAVSNDGKWHHAAFVVDVSRGKLTLYRDYRPVASADAPADGLVASTAPVCIAGVDTDNVAFDGEIDDARITLRALKPGEFLSGKGFDAENPTLGWVGFEDSILNVSGALTAGTADKATSTGSVPVFVAHGRNPKIIDGGDPATVLRTDNVKALAFNEGVVKYPDNLLLPLFPEQTVEFMIKAGSQTTYAGLIRCNVEPDSAEVPAWGLSFGASDQRLLRVRAAVVSESGETDNSAINEDTTLVIGDNRWHHVALTIKMFRDEQNARKTTLALYKDYSAEPGWTKTVDGWLNYGSGVGSVWLGASSSTTAFFKGALDELRISQGVLRPEQFLRSVKNGLIMIVE